MDISKDQIQIEQKKLIQMDEMANNSFRLLIIAILIWMLGWGLFILLSKDPWTMIAAFFIGMLIFSLFCWAFAIMAIGAIIGGTKHKIKASFTAIIGLIVPVFMVLLIING